jgi:ABC-2 type transport system permease protein
VIPHSFSESFSGLIIENGTFSQTTGAIWSMVIIGTICGILSYIALYFKRKNVLKEV